MVSRFSDVIILFKFCFIADPRFNANQFQSFDRLYRTRSESQTPQETIQEVQNEQQELTNTKQVKIITVIHL